MNDHDRKAAALALHTVSDLFMTIGALVELGDDAEAARQLTALRAALNAADPRALEGFAQVLTAATAPILAPGVGHGRALFRAFMEHGGGDAHLSEHDRMARELNLPESWTDTVEELRREGPKTVEEWEEEARLRTLKELN